MDATSEPDSPPSQRIPVVFTGNASDYFAIWIVNMLLTGVTLGIYSAWAKLRSQRYFYGHTRIDGDGLDYRTTGWRILCGRLILLGAIVLFSLFTNLLPHVLLQSDPAQMTTAIIRFLVLICVFPYLFVLSRRFRARVTVWRGVRCNFHGSVGGAVIALFRWPTFTGFSLGLLAPFSTRYGREYLLNNHSFGHAHFSASTHIGAHYRIYAISIAILLAGLLLFLVPAWSTLTELLQTPDLNSQPRHKNALVSQLMIFALPLFVFLPLAALYHTAATHRLMLNHLSLDGGHRFISTLSPARFIWVTVSNIPLILFSGGLLSPWAKVRRWRLLCQTTFIESAGSLDAFIDAQEGAPGSVGADAVVAFEGIDIPL